ncbi:MULTISPECIES: aldehyde dehydrogenase family protein [unclassified Bradyrhizobium]|uniref:aldehyde dehydrogenase family protein n=1 Tax=unclassified Bradyrhizobium TaxID=2631580 RepID=UPI00209784B3|nr:MULTISPECIES: aldehyde dehydrogenase family protein [unclassified Bradyrhizobium]
MHSRQAGAGSRNYRGRFCRSCAPLHAAAHDRRPQRSICGRRDRDQPRGRSPYRSTCAIDDGRSGYSAVGPHGAFYPPTLLDHVRATSELVVEETFGPVLPIIHCPNDIEQSYQSRTLPSLDFPRVFALTGLIMSRD